MRESECGGRGASQKTHPVSGLLPVTYSSRHGDQRRSNLNGLYRARDVAGDRCRFGCFGLAVDQFFQFLAGLEVRHLLRRHIHLVTRLGIPALAGLALAEAEAAESAQLDLLAPVQRVDDAPEHRVDDDFRMLLREIRHARHFLDELRLGHAAARSIHYGLLTPGLTRPGLLWRAPQRAPYRFRPCRKGAPYPTDFGN